MVAVQLSSLANVCIADGAIPDALHLCHLLPGVPGGQLYGGWMVDRLAGEEFHVGRQLV